jgi:hypothetical protein
VLAGCRFNITVRSCALPSLSPRTHPQPQNPAFYARSSPARCPVSPPKPPPTLPKPPVCRLQLHCLLSITPESLCSSPRGRFVPLSKDALAPYRPSPPTTDHTSSTQPAHTLIAKPAPRNCILTPWLSASQTTMSSLTAGRCGRR